MPKLRVSDITLHYVEAGAGESLVLIMGFGGDDILVPPHFSRELAAAIPGAELRVVTDAGHLYFLEQPDIFNGLCVDFLARVA